MAYIKPHNLNHNISAVVRQTKKGVKTMANNRTNNQQTNRQSNQQTNRQSNQQTNRQSNQQTNQQSNNNCR